MQYSEQEQQEALKRRDLSELTKMLNDGVDVNTLVVPKHTDILLTSMNKEHRSLFKTVLSKGFRCKNSNGFLYSHHAIRTHELFFIQAIKEHFDQEGKDFNEHNSNRENGLHIAAGENEISFDVFQFLTDVGIRWEERNNYGETPLHILLNNRAIIEIPLVNLLEKQIKAFHIPDNNGVTSLELIKVAMKESDWKLVNAELVELLDKVK